MKHQSIIMTAFISLLLIGCTKDEFLKEPASSNYVTQYLIKELDDLQNENVNTKMNRRPFKSHSTGTINLEMSNACGPAPLVIVEGDGTGTHLGKFAVQFEFCGDGMSPPTGKITAANGDQIFIVITGEMEGPSPLEPIQTVEVLSGTGRFLGVSGMWTNRGIIDVANQYFDHYSEGWIKY